MRGLVPPARLDAGVGGGADRAAAAERRSIRCPAIEAGDRRRCRAAARRWSATSRTRSRRIAPLASERAVRGRVPRADRVPRRRPGAAVDDARRQLDAAADDRQLRRRRWSPHAPYSVSPALLRGAGRARMPRRRCRSTSANRSEELTFLETAPGRGASCSSCRCVEPGLAAARRAARSSTSIGSACSADGCSRCTACSSAARSSMRLARGRRDDRHLSAQQPLDGRRHAAGRARSTSPASGSRSAPTASPASRPQHVRRDGRRAAPRARRAGGPHPPKRARWTAPRRSASARSSARSSRESVRSSSPSGSPAAVATMWKNTWWEA